MNNNTIYEWILLSTFTVSARMKSLESAKPHLSGIIHPGDRVLDLCCGSGFVSFWLEEQGARVTGVDFAPYMIALAREEAHRRHSTVEFIEADIFTQDFGRECFDLVTCFDSISDFPISDFARLGRKIADSLKPGRRFAVKYMDGISRLIEGTSGRQGVYQEQPERITFRVKEYLPELGAMVNTIRNETREEQYDRKGYIYTPTIVSLAMSNALERKEHILLEPNQYFDVFVKS
jgi:SAM-dependent methyltransferase